jgi:type III secretory pathway component EscR
LSGDRQSLLVAPNEITLSQSSSSAVPGLILLIPIATVALGIQSLDQDLQLTGVLLILWLFVAILVCEIRLLL